MKQGIMYQKILAKAFLILLSFLTRAYTLFYVYIDIEQINCVYEAVIRVPEKSCESFLLSPKVLSY